MSSLSTRKQRGSLPMVFLWMLVFFAFLEGVAGLAVEFGLPEARDATFVEHLHRLQARMREAPGRPLVVVLGSSRTSLGVKAGDLSGPPGSIGPLVYNLGADAAGPMLELVYVKRLLQEGIRPDHLYVEILPLLFNQAPGQPSAEEIWPLGGRLSASELRQVWPYEAKPLRSWRQWFEKRWAAALTHRSVLCACLLGTPYKIPSNHTTLPADAHGFRGVIMAGLTREICQARADALGRQAAPGCKEFHLAPGAVAALQDLLTCCKEHHIPTTLLLMPESTTYREVCRAKVRPGIDAFLSELVRTRKISLIDARDWVADDDFLDGHHLLPAGADAFTRRFGRELRLATREQ